MLQFDKPLAGETASKEFPLEHSRVAILLRFQIVIEANKFPLEHSRVAMRHTGTRQLATGCVSA